MLVPMSERLVMGTAKNLIGRTSMGLVHIASDSGSTQGSGLEAPTKAKLQGVSVMGPTVPKQDCPESYSQFASDPTSTELWIKKLGIGTKAEGRGDESAQRKDVQAQKFAIALSKASQNLHGFLSDYFSKTGGASSVDQPVEKELSVGSKDLSPKTVQTTISVKDVLLHVDHIENMQTFCHDIYVCQPPEYPLGSVHARAVHTIADKEVRTDIGKVETPDHIKQHLDHFRRDSAVCIVPKRAREMFCKTHLGHAEDNAQFVLHKAQFDDICRIVSSEGGTIEEMELRIEELCGIPKDAWKDLYVAVYKEKDLDKIGLRFVSGKEALANAMYGAGGVTRGGMREAIVNRVSVDQVVFFSLRDYLTQLAKKS